MMEAEKAHHETYNTTLKLKSGHFAPVLII